MNKSEETPDFVVINNGTLSTFVLLAQGAKDWVKENVGVPDYMSIPNGLRCEHGYVANIIHGLQEAGFVGKFTS